MNLMPWSNWEAINTKTEHGGAAVYEIGFVDADGTQDCIPRFLGIDSRGVISIGKTGNMETRRSQFIYAVKTCSGHSEGNLLYYLLEHSPLKERFPDYGLMYRFQPEENETAAGLAEERLIKAYIREFGEVPPLNSAIPKRYRSWKPS